MGINDWDAGGETLATYIANMQTIITAMFANGCAVIIVKTTPTNPIGQASVVRQTSFVQAIDDLAAKNNCVCIDLFGLWQSYAVTQPVGLYFDTFHPNSHLVTPIKPI